jgi:hypothetical protein
MPWTPIVCSAFLLCGDILHTPNVPSCDAGPQQQQQQQPQLEECKADSGKTDRTDGTDNCGSEGAKIVGAPAHKGPQYGHLRSFSGGSGVAGI